MTARRLSMVVIGSLRPPLSALLEDVVGELDLHLVLASEGRGVPDLVLVLIEHPREALELVAEACGAARGAPVLAVAPLTDDWLARRVRLAGARACYALDRPLAELQRVILGLLGGDGAATSAPPADPASPRRRPGAGA